MLRFRRRGAWLLPASLALVALCLSTARATQRRSPPNYDIAFATDRDGNFEIYLMADDGSNVRRLTNNTFGDMSAAWFPNGQDLVFASNRDGAWRLYLMRADGTQQRPLPGSRPTDFDPAVSPKGDLIAFETQRAGQEDIYVIPARGGTARRLAATHADESNVAWSPTGDRLAFQRQDRDGLHIYVVNAAGGRPRRATAGRVADAYPVWTVTRQRAHQRIVFSRTDSGITDFFRVKPSDKPRDRTPAARYRSESGVELQPAFARDARLAYTLQRGENDLDVYTSEHGNLTANSPGDDFQPEWRPVAAPREATGVPTLRIASPSCTWDGGDGIDFHTGGTGEDILCGHGGNDTLHGSSANDTVSGGSGEDHVYGDTADDVVKGGLDRDRLYGNDGADTLKAIEDPARRDCVYGGRGHDVAFLSPGLDNRPPCHGRFRIEVKP